MHARRARMYFKGEESLDDRQQVAVDANFIDGDTRLL